MTEPSPRPITLVPRTDGEGDVKSRSTELVDKIKALAYQYPGLPVSAIIGCLEIAKVELIREAEWTP